MRLFNVLNDGFLGFVFLRLEVLLGDKLEDLINKYRVHHGVSRSSCNDPDVRFLLDHVGGKAQHGDLRIRLFQASAQLLLFEDEFDV